MKQDGGEKDESHCTENPKSSVNSVTPITTIQIFKLFETMNACRKFLSTSGCMFMRQAEWILFDAVKKPTGRNSSTLKSE